MIHEDAARKAHPGACEFRPVRNRTGISVIGWTFDIPREDTSFSIDHGWVTLDGEVSEDRLVRPDDARRNLRAYCSIRKRENRKQRPGSVL